MLPNDVGVRLYSSLQQWFRVVLSSTCPDHGMVQTWLARQGLKGHGQVLSAEGLPEPFEDIDIRANHLRMLRSGGTPVGLLIDHDPRVVTHAMQVGVTGLCFGMPRTAERRLDIGRQGIRDWSSIEEEYADRERTVMG